MDSPQGDLQSVKLLQFCLSQECFSFITRSTEISWAHSSDNGLETRVMCVQFLAQPETFIVCVNLLRQETVFYPVCARWDPISSKTFLMQL